MTLRWIEGFDTLDPSFNTSLQDKWGNNLSAGLASSSITPHGVGDSCLMNSSSDFAKLRFKDRPQDFPNNSIGTGIIGFHFRSSVAPVGDILELLGDTGTGVHCTIQCTAGSVLEVERGDGTSLGVGTTVLSLDTWYHIEVKYNIDDSIAGSTFIVYLDGSAEVALTASTDTQNGPNNGMGGITLNGVASANRYFDNFYLCDTLGSFNNAPFGPAYVEPILPDGDGTTNFVGNDGNSVDNYLQVDELAADTTTWNQTAVDQEVDRYTYPEPTGTPSHNLGEIRGIALISKATKLTTNQGQMQNIAFVSGNTTAGTLYNLAEDYYNWLYDVFETNPESNNFWGGGQIDTNEFGVRYNR
jgi:hypothetical protein